MPKDRRTDMVILGLLSHEDLTGYDIKKRIDGAISFFWKSGFGSIYPSLSAMEKDGLITRLPPADTDKNSAGTCPVKSGREKIYYSITDSGRKALTAWLEDERASNDLKYETILKLFFGAAADTAYSLRAVMRFEEDIQRELAVLRTYESSLSSALGDRDHQHYYLTVRFGIETCEAYLRWCGEAREMLRE